MTLNYIVYTYQLVNGSLVCHAYGPTDQTTGQNLATKLETPGVQTMVLELEPIPQENS